MPRHVEIVRRLNNQPPQLGTFPHGLLESERLFLLRRSYANSEILDVVNDVCVVDEAIARPGRQEGVRVGDVEGIALVVEIDGVPGEFSVAEGVVFEATWRDSKEV